MQNLISYDPRTETGLDDLSPSFFSHACLTSAVIVTWLPSIATSMSSFYRAKEQPMYLIPTPTRQSASPVLRDRFLNALDQYDQPALRETVRDLLGCVNPLPAGTCIRLGLAPRSTYGDAANAITSSLRAKPDAA